jgi:glycosyltransferase involved in cell wall biosynthesis
MRMIFHYPGPFYESPATGEQRRPPEMCRAFEALGLQVHRIIGHAAERKAGFDAVKDEFDQFDFIYSENSTLPLRLVEPSHVPLIPSPDYALFRSAARNKLPAGVFYRDLHWRRPGFPSQVGRLKHTLSLPFYRSEVRLYLKTMKKIYIPSLRLTDLLPRFKDARIAELPPGGTARDVPKNPDPNTLKMVYVGNVRPPVYNVPPLIEAAEALADQGVELEMAIPKGAETTCLTTDPLPQNVTFHSATGNELDKIYGGKDLALLMVPGSMYAKQAVYVKLFEAVGYGLPVVGFKGTRCGEWIEKEGIGWVVEPSELTNLIRFLAGNKAEVVRKTEQVLAVRQRHTWEARARQVVADLTG